MVKAATRIKQLRMHWEAAWEPALGLWSRFVKLKPPVFCENAACEKREQLSGSFAMIRLKDHAVVISLCQVRKLKLEAFAREILGHEIGHHVYTPADLNDHARLITRTRAGLPGKEHLAGFVSNLYTDLLINNRLQRGQDLDMAGVYLALEAPQNDPLWQLYMRIYEILWCLPTNTLIKARLDARTGTDAQLGARLISVYAGEWLDGAGRFAALCFPYLRKDEGQAVRAVLAPFLDSQEAGAGDVIPDGLVAIDPDEAGGAIHPALDPRLSETRGSDGSDDTSPTAPRGGGDAADMPGGRKNDYRSPAQYTDLLQSLGVNLAPHEMVARYYRERALPHLIKFPSRRLPRTMEPIPEGVETWDIGSPIGDIDWVGTLSASPRVVPGYTTVQRVHGVQTGSEPAKQPPDLYLGIDCSGSMPNPALQLSFPALAGTIISLSALRAGARVMAVLSGEAPGKYSETNGYVTNVHQVLDILTGYLGTGYAFGIQRLESAFLKAGVDTERKIHILIISDSDMFSMLHGNGWDIARQALEKAGGGGTFVLHRVRDTHPDVARMRSDGWDVYGIVDWESLVTFARDFARKTYQDTP